MNAAHTPWSSDEQALACMQAAEPPPQPAATAATAPPPCRWRPAAQCHPHSRFHPPCPCADDGTVFRAGLLSTQDELKAQYDSSKPYPHCVIRELCNPDLLRQVRCSGCRACC